MRGTGTCTCVARTAGPVGGRDAAGVAAPARRLPRAAWSRFCAAAVVLRREETERRDFCSFNGLRLNSEAVMICRDDEIPNEIIVRTSIFFGGVQE